MFEFVDNDIAYWLQTNDFFAHDINRITKNIKNLIAKNAITENLYVLLTESYKKNNIILS